MLRLSKYFFLVIFFQAGIKLQAQNSYSPRDSVYTYAVVNALLKEGYQRKMFPGLSAALFQNDSTYYFNYGYSKIESKVEISNDTRFQLGSVGKLMTAIAVLKLVEEGKLELKDDITKYLGELGLDFGFKDNPLTLHCLLTHSCGFNDVNIGYLARDSQSILPLEEYVKQSNPGLFQPPGTDIVYSNYSYALAGLIIERVTRVKFADYISGNIFQPLGMSNSSLNFPIGYEKDSNYADGYRKTDNGFVELQLYPRHAVPAGSLVSTTKDMGKFVKALLNQDSKLLSVASWNLFYTQQFTAHPLLNGYSYGLEHQNINGVEAWAKGGMLQGVLSNIFILPHEYAYFSVVNTSDDRFGEYFFKALFDSISPNVNARKKIKKTFSIEKYTGEYRNKRYNRNTVENIVSLFSGIFNIYSNSTQDTLRAYHNGKFHSYVPIDEDVFQNTELPYEYFVFKEDEKGNVETLHRNLNIGGLSVPTSYEKTRWYNSAYYINEFYPIPFFILAGFLFAITSIVIRMIRIWKKEFFNNKLLPVKFHILFSTILILVVIHTFIGPIYLLKSTQEFLFGYPFYFKVATVIGYLLFGLTIGLGLVLRKIWRERTGSIFSRCLISIVGFGVLMHLIYLFYWNFL